MESLDSSFFMAAASECYFLAAPRPEQVCDPDKAQWDGRCIDYETEEEREGMIDLQAWLIFDYMRWEADRIHQEKLDRMPRGIPVLNDVGWRPLLKEAISRTRDWWSKRRALNRFHEEFAYLTMK